MEELIKNFLTITSDSGDGDGYGSGSGDGSGDGYGYGYGDGSGDGSGDGYGYGSGSGDGSGDGYGYGYGDGSGDGSGDGYGLTSLNNQKIYLIDEVQTIIKSVKNNVAKGFIVNKDLTLTKCFIVKGENQFSHGETLELALNSLQEKLLLSKPIEERIEDFKTKFNNLTDEYQAKDFYKWHFLLTGSCDIGRKSFVNDKGIDLENDKFSVLKFIDLVKDSYGSDIIRQLKESYEIKRA
jgi:hypothetical protein